MAMGLALAALLGARPGMAASPVSAAHLEVKLVGQIALGKWDELSLEDVDSAGRVLLVDNYIGGVHPIGAVRPRVGLLVWNLSEGKFTRRVFPNWTPPRGSRLTKTLLDSFRIGREPFALLPGGREAVGTYGYYVVHVNLVDGNVQWILSSRRLADSKPPFRAASYAGGRIAVLAMSPSRDRFAVAFNIGPWPALFIFRPGSDEPIAKWRLARFAQSLAWSPDEKRIAVLYNSQFDEHLRDLKWNAAGSHLPNLALFSVRTGERKLLTFTGAPEARVEFSKDGTWLYCIDAGMGTSLYESDRGIRVLSARDGRRIRVFRGGRHGVVGNFAQSPDGKLIVADASIRPPPWKGAYNEKLGRFTVLDSLTGRVLFHQRGKMMSGVLESDPYVFAFAPDGRRLLVESGKELGPPGSRAIEIYSISGHGGVRR